MIVNKVLERMWKETAVASVSTAPPFAWRYHGKTPKKKLR
jgi:hypothetical protein